MSKLLLLSILLTSVAGCAALLPEQVREQVRRDQPEVQPDYSRTAPPTKDSASMVRLRELVQVGMDVDVLYERCGEPDSTLARGRKLIYDSCEGSVRFEAEIRRGKITRLWY